MAAPVFAQTQTASAASTTSLGVRAGVSAQPDQFFIGGDIESPRLGPTQRDAFRPNIEIGFGGDEGTHLAGNVEIVGCGLFVEMKTGVSNRPSLKATVGYVLKTR